jgi:hypothetical protein
MATAPHLAKEGCVYGAGGARAPLGGLALDMCRERGRGEDHVGHGVIGWLRVGRRSAAAESPTMSGGRGAPWPPPPFVSPTMSRRRALSSCTWTQSNEEAAGLRIDTGRVQARASMVGGLVVGDGCPATVRLGRGTACIYEGGRGAREREACIEVPED